MPMDYWENVEEYRDQVEDADDPEEIEIEPAPGVDRADLEISVEELVRERTDDMWTLVGISLADRDDSDGTMYLLVVRYGVGDSGDLLLDERYFSVDPRDPWSESSGYSSNGITRNVSGEGMLLSLKLIYSAIGDYSDNLDDLGTQIMEASNGKLIHNSEKMTEDLSELLGIPDAEETVQTEAVCVRCGQSLDLEEDPVVSMEGDLGDIWIHDPDQGGCPDE
jgi:hypothetical protein